MVVPALWCLVALLATCSSDGGTRNEPDDSRVGATAGGRGEIIVSAAASLTEAFTLIAAQVEEAHPGDTVTVNFGSSGQLAAQVRSGAPADVVAFADRTSMDDLAAAGLLEGTPASVATNRLVVVTPAGNPAGIGSLADLADAGVISLCVDTAPCGRYAATLLDDAGVTVEESNVTRGQDARGTLGAVTRGDAAAAVVYRTDALAAGDLVETIDVEGTNEVVATYVVATVGSTTNPELARAFVDQVLSHRGQEVLRDAGFLAP